MGGGGAVDVVLRSIYGLLEGRLGCKGSVRLRCEENCDLSPVSCIVRAMESKVMKCAGIIADL